MVSVGYLMYLSFDSFVKLKYSEFSQYSLTNIELDLSFMMYEFASLDLDFCELVIASNCWIFDKIWYFLNFEIFGVQTEEQWKY